MSHNDNNKHKLIALEAIQLEVNRVAILLEEMESSTELDQHWVNEAKKSLNDFLKFANFSVTHEKHPA